MKVFSLCLVFAAVCLLACFPRPLCSETLEDVIDGIANGRSLSLTQAIRKQMNREQAYLVCRGILNDSIPEGVDHIVEALRIWTEESDLAGASAAFQTALAASEDAEDTRIFELLQGAVIQGRDHSRDVSDIIQDFLDHMIPRLKEYRGIDDMGDQSPSPKFSTPEGTWEAFVKGLGEADWKLVAMTLSAQLPEGLDLAPLDKTEEIARLKTILKRAKPEVRGLDIKASSPEKITDDIAALNIQARGSNTNEKFWVIFEKRNGAWALVGTMEDIDLLKASVSK